jgi:hypothetical protein
VGNRGRLKGGEIGGRLRVGKRGRVKVGKKEEGQGLGKGEG